jgi:septal ring factor EnvC (AmiA/AmiB activator)
MSKSEKTIAFVVIIGLIICAVLYVAGSKNDEQSSINKSVNDDYAATQRSGSTQQTPQQTTETGDRSTTDTTADSAVKATSPTDNSDAALDKDLSAVDSQLKDLDTDSASIDSGLNDQPLATE